MGVSRSITQSPKAYDQQNLTAAKIAVRLAAGAAASMRENLRTALQDSGFRFSVTDSETAAGLADSDLTYGYDQGDSRRYGMDNTGATFVTQKFQRMLDAAGHAATAGDVQTVVVFPGTYKVTRLYMNFSNVYLCLLPGAIIKQDRGGSGADTIVDSNSTGTTPAYAIIHINPSTYTCNPASAITAIDNVRIFGGGWIQGPYTTGTPDGYFAFSLGVVSNDCSNCTVMDVKIFDCRSELLLHGPSAWNTVRNTRILNCEFTNGGEVGINNCRDFLIVGNYYHDNWMQNGFGGAGDGGIIAENNIANCQQAGLSVGGSGARDINACRNIVVANNRVHNTGLRGTGYYQLSCLDDGATTTPKQNILIMGNLLTAHQGNLACAFDFAVASSNVDFVDNVVSGIVGSDPTLWAVIANSAIYTLKGNSFWQVGGNASRCVQNQSTTAVIYLKEGNFFDPTIATSIQDPPHFIYSGVQKSGTFTGTLTGCTTSPTATFGYVLDGNHVTIRMPGLTATSNASTCTVTGLPAEIVPINNQNFTIPITDNGTNALGIVQFNSDGKLHLFKDINASGFTSSGTKGLSGPYDITGVLN